jgi:hypothetical protein
VAFHDFDAKFPVDAVEELLKTKEKWDGSSTLGIWAEPKLIGRAERSVPADFPATARFVQFVPAPECKIILFPWWIPSGPYTKEGTMEVFLWLR